MKPGKKIRRTRSSGFTLIELLVVVAILGILASVAVVATRESILKAKVSAAAGDLRTFKSGFINYTSDHGQFPPDSHLDAPYHLASGSGAEHYIPVDRWVSETVLGGNYNWEGPDSYPYAGVSVFKPTASAAVFAQLDATLDDGDVGTGRFRLGENGRYTYIIDE